MERVHPSFCLLKKQVDFKWMEEHKRAFQDLKRFLVESPVPSKPKDAEPLYVYLSVAERAISLVLVREDQKQQKPVYYVSNSLQGVEVKYQKIEKLAFSLVITARGLRPYF